MKTRFNTYDIICSVTELQKLVGLRVNQVYDIDNKTYLIRLQEKEQKDVLLLESGLRFHTTAFEWPKNVAPSGFTMKLRKHLKNKRLEKFQQLGIDRIVDFQFGVGEAAYHVILELYDRGNIILTDHEMTILNILRPHVEGEEKRFAVREKYPMDRARKDTGPPSMEKLREAIKNARPGDSLRTILNPVLIYGASVIDHVLHKYDLFGSRIAGELEDTEGGKKKNRKNKKSASGFEKMFNPEDDMMNLMCAVNDAETMTRQAMSTASNGYIIQKKEAKPNENDFFYTNIEYHPFLYNQYKKEPFKEFPNFTSAVDEFYSLMESQKIDLKAIQMERDALKKLSNVKEDHAKRLDDLSRAQLFDRKKAELITRNQSLVDSALLAIQSALANQMSWTDIQDLVKAAQANKDPVASVIKQLKLETNHISLYLTDPYAILDDEDDDSSDHEEDEGKLEPMAIDVDLSLSAYANARRYYDLRRYAAKKEQKTIESSTKALKNAEKKTLQTLKEVKTQTSISKVRKTYWFEKFYWFISSENYLVIGGRDQQQNELIVKRYMRPADIYVHAEIQGASSVLIKNPGGGEIPPKTLLEAGTMAISYSVAWDAKVVTSAYWVKAEQVSKTAPTGEYLSTGSFMIRGKKNFLPPCHLVLGLSFLFKLEDGSIERHKGERRVRAFEEDIKTIEEVEEVEEGVEAIKIEEDDENENDEDDGEDAPKFPDTHVKIEHNVEDLETVIIEAAPLRVKQIQKSKMKAKQKEMEKEKKEKKQEKKEDLKPGQVKRGQRSKMKKIKEKYRDQDEDDRKMIMEILQSAGPSKEETKEDDQPKEEDEEVEKVRKGGKKQFQKPTQDMEDIDDTPAQADVDMLDSLTGLPVDEDEVLFAVPLVAPYQALQHHYKFKVKLTPGTGKRGKASKMALQIFLKDKSCTQREKDLIKAVKDETIARNIPGKVKLSAPQLQKVKK